MDKKDKKPVNLEDLNGKDISKDQKEVLKLIIKKNGKTYQSTLVKELTFSKVKVSRIVKELEEKKIIKKEKFGMTNTVTLTKKL